ncbi:phage tail tape measure protein [Nitratidesulfovibrio vulgaris]|uniref:phage tail tape measure protein n=1 Tax=Nitratidesulfovibrio vulgaris TaxID=881 RepID=UPI0013DF142B|nr:phage tail tape measure protein [Nitratidesulfovibrio vulgaris]
MAADIHTRIIVSARDMASSTFRKVSLEAEALKGRLTSMQGMVAGTLGAVGVGVGISETLRETARFETALADMGKVSTRSFGEIKSEIMALPPELGSATELMEGYYQTMSAGVTEPVAAMDMLVTASKAAKGAHVQQGEVIKALTKVMTGFAGELTTAAEASDLLFAIEKDGQTTVAELVPHIGSLAALSREVGVAATEMGGGLAQITQTAGSTSDAATQLKAILIGLYKPTEEMGKLLKRMGYESGQALVADRGFVGALQALREAADKAGKPLSKMFESSEALIGISALAANNFSGVNEKIRSMANAAGMTDKAYNDFKRTLEGTWETAQNTIGHFALVFGNEWAPSVKRAVEDTQKWLMSHDADIAEWGRESGESLESLMGTVRSFIDVYKSVPDEITGPAGTGIIGTMLFGRKVGVFLAAVHAATEIGEKYSKFAAPKMLDGSLISGAQSGSVFGDTMDAIKGRVGLGPLQQIGMGVMAWGASSNKKQADLAAWRKAAGLRQADGGGGSPSYAMPTVVNRPSPSPSGKSAGGITLGADTSGTDKMDAALKKLRTTLADLTQTDADLKLARLREEYAELEKVVGRNNPQLAEMRDLMGEIERTGISPAERKRNQRDFDKELEVLRAEAQVLEVERALATTSGGRKSSDGEIQAALERARLEQQATEWRKKGIDEERIGERMRLEGIKIEADARKKNGELTVQFERAYRETVLGTTEARLAAIREEADAYIAAGADRIRVEEWVREQTLRISRSGSDGAMRALRDYHDAATDMGKGMEQLVGNTFSSIESNFSLTTKGMSINWSNMVDGMLNDIMRLTLRKSVTGPLAGMLGSIGSSLFGGGGDGASLWANGGVFNGAAGLHEHVNTVVNRPTLFAFAKGAGIMGEAGPEGIFPLGRDSRGRLGVRSVGGNGAQAISLDLTLVYPDGKQEQHRFDASNMQFDGERWVATQVMSGVRNNTAGIADFFRSGASR